MENRRTRIPNKCQNILIRLHGRSWRQLRTDGDLSNTIPRLTHALERRDCQLSIHITRVTEPTKVDDGGVGDVGAADRNVTAREGGGERGEDDADAGSGGADGAAANVLDLGPVCG